MLVANRLTPAPIVRVSSAAIANEPGDVFTAAPAADWKPPTMKEMQRSLTQLPNGETASWSDFALGRHKPGLGYSYFKGSNQELVDLVQAHWGERQPGTGRSDLKEVVAVPVPADQFMTTTVEVGPDTKLDAQLYRRREHEEPYVRVTASGEAAPARHAQVILYSHATLAKNNEHSSDSDWEVVSLVASPVENEPMDPVTMMRNMKGKAGGTQVTYSAEQLLNSIEFWSTHAKIG